MAESNDTPRLDLQMQDANIDIDDNESVTSNENENTQDFSRLESDIKEQMTTIANQVKDSISGLSNHMQCKLNEFDRSIQRMELKLSEQAKQIRDNHSHSGVSSLTMSNENSNNLHHSSIPDNHTSTHDPGQTISESFSSNTAARGDNYVKLKPQSYSGSDDFEDFLAQFDITAEINGWDYRAKSLYLANSLIGDARSLLNELNDEQRRDYKSLVQKLTSRFGSENRAEVFRAQLKSRVKAKGESIAQLAHSIKKLTRQSYPNASQDVIEALALDHFIDALSEAEIRLRLREVGPKSLSEAEAIAVRMEAHRIADRQRTRLVGKVEQASSDNSYGQKELQSQLFQISKNLDVLQKRVENLSHQRSQPSFKNNNTVQNGTKSNHPFHANNRLRPERHNNYSRENNQRWQSQARGGNSNHNLNTNPQAYQNTRNPPQQGNYRQSSQGSGFRLN